MFDKIEAKLHEIRQQPEHIRMRYVWGALIIMMSFVIFIWLISMKISFFNLTNDMKKNQTSNDIQKRIEKIRENSSQTQTPVSIDELLDQAAIENGQ